MKHTLLFLLAITLRAGTITDIITGVDQNSGQALIGTIMLDSAGQFQSGDVQFLGMDFTTLQWQGNCIDPTALGPCVSEIILRNGNDHLLYLLTLGEMFTPGPLCSISDVCWDWNTVNGKKDGVWLSQEDDITAGVNHYLLSGTVIDPPSDGVAGAAVPEPATLFLVGSALLVGFVWRKVWH